jgi:GNAT superfamily N-acetyltransferase
MYTIPSARRQGISRLILNELIANARRMGVAKLALHTSQDGEHLYRTSGFHEPIYPFLELGL